MAHVYYMWRSGVRASLKRHLELQRRFITWTQHCNCN